MLVLLKRLRAWRGEMLVRGTFSPGELSELEDHLLVEGRRLIEQGQRDDDAFREALRRIGTVQEIEGEFQTGRAMAGRPRTALSGAVFAILLQLCQWAQNVVLLCLPALAVTVPFAVFAKWQRANVAELMPGEPLPGVTRLWFECSALIEAYAPVAIPALLLIVVLPTLVRLRQLRDQTGLGLPALLAAEVERSRPFLLGGLIAYPLLALVVGQAGLLPLIRLVNKLGG